LSSKCCFNLDRSLALQGAFLEHQAMLQRLELKLRVTVIQVRTTEELSKCDALVIPGGGE
jgi:5'-phosphate synthase pdxT subunit